MTQSFDFNKVLKDLQAGKGLNGKEVILTPLIKQLAPELDRKIRSLFSYGEFVTKIIFLLCPR